jgi:hypothetical protein
MNANGGVPLVFGLCLTLLTACAAVQPTPQRISLPPFQPTIEHWAARGCKGEHDTINLAAGHINAYPGWPPRAQPEFIVLHYDTGDVIWGKPSYQTPQCADFTTCRRATFILNPTWNQCSPSGHLYEVETFDGLPVLESSLLWVTDTSTQARVFIAFACGKALAGPDLASVANQARQSGCLAASSGSQGSRALAPGSIPQVHPYLKAAVSVVGTALVAAAVVGTAYFVYRTMAAQSSVACTTFQAGTMWNTYCF